ncbi:response regulator [Rudanella lutea]|uniref:response regulator n=1 Tax=Rudanella lutea TaxID=451374 RepID=UPI000377E912|nr:response regulator [Rudanella lutea]
MNNDKQLSILLVESDSNTAQLIRNTLQTVDPISVLEVASSQDELVAILDKATLPFFDILLLDLKYEAELNGPLVIDLVRNYPCTQLMPIVALASQEDFQAAMASHHPRVNSYLPKPETFEGWSHTLKLFTDYWKETLLSIRVLMI